MATVLAGAIFDLDNLLVQTEQVYDEAIQQYAVDLTGERIPEAEFWAMRSKMYGKKPIESATMLHQQLGLATSPDAFLQWRAPFLARSFAHCTLMPGAEQVVSLFQDKKIPIVLATGSEGGLAELKLSDHPHIRQAFGKNVVTSDMVSRGKPAPDLFLLAAKTIGVPPRQCVVFEDAVNGVEAGLAAGMRVVAVPDTQRTRRDEFPVDKRVTVLSSLEEFRL